MKNSIRYLILIAILLIIVITIIQKSFPLDNILKHYVTLYSSSVATNTQTPLNSLKVDLVDLPSYSETAHKNLFNRTSYIDKQRKNLSEFASIIAKAAGLDQSSSLRMPREIVNSTVLILSANMAYADMTYNFLCRLTKISKTFKYVVVAQDASLYNFLQSHNIPSISGSLIHPASTQNAANFSSPGFNAISIAKIIASRIVLELGYHVLFSDVDIAWKINPLPFLSADVDLTIQSNSGTNLFPVNDEPNTGFYFMKSNDRSMTLLDEIINRAQKNPNIDDQGHFANVLRDWRTSGKAFFIREGTVAPWTYHSYRPFTFRLLHPYSFQSGQVAKAWFAHKVEPPYDGNEQDIVIVHANYMVGHSTKVDFLKSHELWDVNDHLFLAYFDQWKSNSTRKKQRRIQDEQISYKLALETLMSVCLNLIT